MAFRTVPDFPVSDLKGSGTDGKWRFYCQSSIVLRIELYF